MEVLRLSLRIIYIISTMNVRPDGGTFVLHTIGTLSLPRKVHLNPDFKLPSETVEIALGGSIERRSFRVPPERLHAVVTRRELIDHGTRAEVP